MALSDDTRLAWAKDDALLPPMLDVELIPAGRWFDKPAVHVLASMVKSEKAQTVEFRMYRNPSMRILLGDKNVSGDAVVQIPAGETRLLIVTEDGGNTFLRVLKPGTEERITSVQSLRPEIKDAGKSPTAPCPRSPPTAARWPESGGRSSSPPWRPALP